MYTDTQQHNDISIHGAGWETRYLQNIYIQQWN